MARRGKRTNGPNNPEGECVIPPTLPPEILRDYVLDDSQHEANDIVRYVEWQAHEEVIHREKITTEYLPGRKYDVWDVHTKTDRWWVITSPTNLYSQSIFKSLDFTLSLHIGLMSRMMAREANTGGPIEEPRLMAVWRRLSQARDALDRAEETEDFQAVGNRCRDCLLDLIRTIGTSAMVPPDQESPQIANFGEWSVLIANYLAAGSRSEKIRAHLKSVAGTAWPLVSWLVHFTSATREDADLAIVATESVVTAYAAASKRFDREQPKRCGVCDSYRLATDYRPDESLDDPWVTLCAACGAILVKAAATGETSE